MIIWLIKENFGMQIIKENNEKECITVTIQKYYSHTIDTN